jgi:hypothetical protein
MHTNFPPIIIAILSHKNSASSSLWVVNSKLLFWFLASCNKLRLATGSKPTVGSSKNVILGWTNNESAVQSFLLLPPLSIYEVLCP